MPLEISAVGTAEFWSCFVRLSVGLLGSLKMPLLLCVDALELAAAGHSRAIVGAVPSRTRGEVSGVDLGAVLLRLFSARSRSVRSAYERGAKWFGVKRAVLCGGCGSCS